MRWNRHYGEGQYGEQWVMQNEILVQAFANCAFLNLPALVLAFSQPRSFSALEIAGLVGWLASYAWESTADFQKQGFLAANKKNGGAKDAVCQVGLWRLCRHANYFGEWCVWNSVVMLTVPSIYSAYVLASDNAGLLGGAFISAPSWLGAALLLLGTISISWLMYHCLVRYTGAVPAEYFSVRKRPDYKAYQQSTPMFFPDFRKLFESSPRPAKKSE